MKKESKSLLSLIICLFLFSKSFSQDFGNDTLIETRFIAKVKDISEFFERFNDEKNSSLRVYMKQRGLNNKIKRSLLLKSLFNNRSIQWTQPDVSQFVKNVAAPSHPQYIDFTKDGWFAEVICNFRYKNHDAKVHLILKIFYNNSDGSSKWVITAAKWFVSKKINIMPIPSLENDKANFIPPSNQATKFAKLADVFRNGSHLTAFLDSDFFKGKSSSAFFSAVKSGDLHFKSVANIKYHFLQIKNWLFTVEDIENKSNNSGWLITSLRKMPGRERFNYVNNLLNR